MTAKKTTRKTASKRTRKTTKKATGKAANAPARKARVRTSAPAHAERSHACAGPGKCRCSR